MSSLRSTVAAIIVATVSECSALGQTYAINTFAGGYLPNNVAAISAPLGAPSGIAIDSSGNVFFASWLNAVFQLNATTGMLTLIAGNGTYGFSGDTGPAMSAELDFGIQTIPNGAAVDANGNIYIADTLNNRIREVSNGVITTVAGGGGDGTNGAGSGGDNGPATSAGLFGPTGVAVDAAGNLYIADYSNNRVRKVSNGIITTVAGNGTGGFSGDNGPATSADLSPLGVAVDGAGNLYIVDDYANRIREVSNGVITTVAGNGIAGFSGDHGPATSAELSSPLGVSVDAAGNIYIADGNNHRVRKVSNGFITTVAGGGVSLSDNVLAVTALLYLPCSAVADAAGNLYIADVGSGKIRKVTNGIITTSAGLGVLAVGDGGPAVDGELDEPSGVATDAAGNLYIADANNCRVREVSNGVITTVAGDGTCGYVGSGGPATSAQLWYPTGVAVDVAGNLYIADNFTSLIQEVSNGVITTVAGGGITLGDNGPATSAELNSPNAVAVDGEGNFYIADTGDNRIREVSNGVITTVAGNGTAGYSGDNGPAMNAELNTPLGVAVDAAGAIYIADTYNNRIRKVSGGVITTVAGTGTQGFNGDNGPATLALLDNPQGVALDAAGNLYLVDSTRIRKVSNGVITTVAGNGSAGFSGDGGPATSAQLNNPQAVAVDTSGNFYIADALNERIRIATPGCSYSISPLSATPSALGGVGSVTVTVTSGCSWSAVSNASFITVTSGASGSGNGTVGYSVAANSGASRTGTLTIANQTFTVDQAKGTSGPVLSITSSHSGNFVQGQQGATYTVTVSNEPGAGITSGEVTVTETVPSGLTLVSMSGTGWTCPTSGDICTRNDVLNAGASYPAITVTVNVGASASSPQVNMVSVSGGGSASANASDPTTIVASVAASQLQFLPVTPCRVMDTRNANGPLGGPFVAGGTARSIPIPSSACGVPSNAAAYSLNITVVPQTGTLGYLTVWPTGQSQPLVSTLNSLDGSVLANAAIVPAGTGGSVNAFATDDTDLVVDINGYFVPPATSTLQFYPLTPCRVLDTRNADGTFGGPSIAGGSSRSFPIPSSSCGVPANAAAYSFNVTVVPQGALGYLTTWPTGQPQPLVSTLNSLDGTVLANAAIVPTGIGGAVSFYAANTTDLVLDINGYFATPGTGGLNFYTVTPCRVVDTRNPNGTFGGPILTAGATRAFPLSQGSCGLPPDAAAYSLNMTVVPSGELGYLTTWPAGGSQPLVSTLNAFEGQVVANAAIVPGGVSGSVNVYVTNTTQVIIDTNGYFGQ